MKKELINYFITKYRKDIFLQEETKRALNALINGMKTSYQNILFILDKNYSDFFNFNSLFFDLKWHYKKMLGLEKDFIFYDIFIIDAEETTRILISYFNSL